MPLRLYADFNGLFGDVLCLSHDEKCRTPEGEKVAVTEGTLAVALQPDPDEDGNSMELFATGTIERAPESLASCGSGWVLRIDSDGVPHRPPSGAYPSR